MTGERRRDKGGPVAIGKIATAIYAGIRWETRKRPGTEAPGQGAPHGEETISSGVMNLAAVENGEGRGEPLQRPAGGHQRTASAFKRGRASLTPYE